ncbi:MAG: 50S ribosome-binding GTPase, partial [Gammaproteobacteria bacterium]|nr:50S ribosome-binding GTPase [Gammaproteobacteria bacterium]
MSAVAAEVANFRVALVGVPNCGKTALFNRLTGSRQKVANYPGVTVERKEGVFPGPSQARRYRLIDLPGTYSLVPATLDEAITRDAITGKLRGESAPDLIVCVVDATNLRLSLRLVLELGRVGRPLIVALNMSDLAHKRGYRLDRARLETELGVPVVETVAVHPAGARAGVVDRRVVRLARGRAGRDAAFPPGRSHGRAARRRASAAGRA